MRYLWIIGFLLSSCTCTRIETNKELYTKEIQMCNHLKKEQDKNCETIVEMSMQRCSEQHKPNTFGIMCESVLNKALMEESKCHIRVQRQYNRCVFAVSFKYGD